MAGRKNTARKSFQGDPKEFNRYVDGLEGTRLLEPSRHSGNRSSDRGNFHRSRDSRDGDRRNRHRYDEREFDRFDNYNRNRSPPSIGPEKFHQEFDRQSDYRRNEQPEYRRSDQPDYRRNDQPDYRRNDDRYDNSRGWNHADNYQDRQDGRPNRYSPNKWNGHYTEQNGHSPLRNSFENRNFSPRGRGFNNDTSRPYNNSNWRGDSRGRSRGWNGPFSGRGRGNYRPTDKYHYYRKDYHRDEHREERRGESSNSDESSASDGTNEDKRIVKEVQNALLETDTELNRTTSAGRRKDASDRANRTVHVKSGDSKKQKLTTNVVIEGSFEYDSSHERFDYQRISPPKEMRDEGTSPAVGSVIESHDEDVCEQDENLNVIKKQAVKSHPKQCESGRNEQSKHSGSEIDGRKRFCSGSSGVSDSQSGYDSIKRGSVERSLSVHRVRSSENRTCESDHFSPTCDGRERRARGDADKKERHRDRDENGDNGLHEQKDGYKRSDKKLTSSTPNKDRAREKRKISEAMQKHMEKRKQDAAKRALQDAAKRALQQSQAAEKAKEKAKDDDQVASKASEENSEKVCKPAAPISESSETMKPVTTKTDQKRDPEESWLASVGQHTKGTVVSLVKQFDQVCEEREICNEKQGPQKSNLPTKKSVSESAGKHSARASERPIEKVDGTSLQSSMKEHSETNKKSSADSGQEVRSDKADGYTNPVQKDKTSATGKSAASESNCQEIRQENSVQSVVKGSEQSMVPKKRSELEKRQDSSMIRKEKRKSKNAPKCVKQKSDQTTGDAQFQKGKTETETIVLSSGKKGGSEENGKKVVPLSLKPKLGETETVKLGVTETVKLGDTETVKLGDTEKRTVKRKERIRSQSGDISVVHSKKKARLSMKEQHGPTSTVGKCDRVSGQSEKQNVEKHDNLVHIEKRINVFEHFDNVKIGDENVNGNGSTNSREKTGKVRRKSMDFSSLASFAVYRSDVSGSINVCSSMDSNEKVVHGKSVERRCSVDSALERDSHEITFDLGLHFKAHIRTESKGKSASVDGPEKTKTKTAKLLALANSLKSQEKKKIPKRRKSSELSQKSPPESKSGDDVRHTDSMYDVVGQILCDRETENTDLQQEKTNQLGGDKQADQPCVPESNTGQKQVSQRRHSDAAKAGKAHKSETQDASTAERLIEKSKGSVGGSVNSSERLLDSSKSSVGASVNSCERLMDSSKSSVGTSVISSERLVDSCKSSVGASVNSCERLVDSSKSSVGASVISSERLVDSSKSSVGASVSSSERLVDSRKSSVSAFVNSSERLVDSSKSSVGTSVSSSERMMDSSKSSVGASVISSERLVDSSKSSVGASAKDVEVHGSSPAGRQKEQNSTKFQDVNRVLKKRPSVELTKKQSGGGGDSPREIEPFGANDIVGQILKAGNITQPLTISVDKKTSERDRKASVKAPVSEKDKLSKPVSGEGNGAHLKVASKETGHQKSKQNSSSENRKTAGSVKSSSEQRHDRTAESLQAEQISSPKDNECAPSRSMERLQAKSVEGSKEKVVNKTRPGSSDMTERRHQPSPVQSIKSSLKADSQLIRTPSEFKKKKSDCNFSKGTSKVNDHMKTMKDITKNGNKENKVLLAISKDHQADGGIILTKTAIPVQSSGSSSKQSHTADTQTTKEKVNLEDKMRETDTSPVRKKMRLSLEDRTSSGQNIVKGNDKSLSQSDSVEALGTETEVISLKYPGKSSLGVKISGETEEISIDEALNVVENLPKIKKNKNKVKTKRKVNSDSGIPEKKKRKSDESYQPENTHCVASKNLESNALQDKSSKLKGKESSGPVADSSVGIGRNNSKDSSTCQDIIEGYLNVPTEQRTDPLSAVNSLDEKPALQEAQDEVNTLSIDSRKRRKSKSEKSKSRRSSKDAAPSVSSTLTRQQSCEEENEEMEDTDSALYGPCSAPVVYSKKSSGSFRYSPRADRTSESLDDLDEDDFRPIDIPYTPAPPTPAGADCLTSAENPLFANPLRTVSAEGIPTTPTNSVSFAYVQPATFVGMDMPMVTEYQQPETVTPTLKQVQEDFAKRINSQVTECEESRSEANRISDDQFPNSGPNSCDEQTSNPDSGENTPGDTEVDSLPDLPTNSVWENGFDVKHTKVLKDGQLVTEMAHLEPARLTLQGLECLKCHSCNQNFTPLRFMSHSDDKHVQNHLDEVETLKNWFVPEPEGIIFWNNEAEEIWSNFQNLLDSEKREPQQPGNDETGVVSTPELTPCKQELPARSSSWSDPAKPQGTGNGAGKAMRTDNGAMQELYPRTPEASVPAVAWPASGGQSVRRSLIPDSNDCSVSAFVPSINTEPLSVQEPSHRARHSSQPGSAFHHGMPMQIQGSVRPQVRALKTRLPETNTVVAGSAEPVVDNPLLTPVTQPPSCNTAGEIGCPPLPCSSRPSSCQPALSTHDHSEPSVSDMYQTATSFSTIVSTLPTKVKGSGSDQDIDYTSISQEQDQQAQLSHMVQLKRDNALSSQQQNNSEPLNMVAGEQCPSTEGLTSLDQSDAFEHLVIKVSPQGCQSKDRTELASNTLYEEESMTTPKKDFAEDTGKVTPQSSRKTPRRNPNLKVMIEQLPQFDSPLDIRITDVVSHATSTEKVQADSASNERTTEQPDKDEPESIWKARLKRRYGITIQDGDVSDFLLGQRLQLDSLVRIRRRCQTQQQQQPGKLVQPPSPRPEPAGDDRQLRLSAIQEQMTQLQVQLDALKSDDGKP